LTLLVAGTKEGLL